MDLHFHFSQCFTPRVQFLLVQNDRGKWFSQPVAGTFEASLNQSTVGKYLAATTKQATLAPHLSAHPATLAAKKPNVVPSTGATHKAKSLAPQSRKIKKGGFGNFSGW